MRAMTTWFCDATRRGRKAESKTLMADYDDGCRVKSISTQCRRRNPGHRPHCQSHAEKSPRFQAAIPGDPQTDDDFSSWDETQEKSITTNHAEAEKFLDLIAGKARGTIPRQI